MISATKSNRHSIMYRTGVLFATAIIIALLFVIPVFANSAVLPAYVEIYVKHAESLQCVEFYIYDDDGNRLDIDSDEFTDTPYVLTKDYIVKQIEKSRGNSNDILLRFYMYREKIEGKPGENSYYRAMPYSIKFTYEDGTAYESEIFTPEEGQRQSDKYVGYTYNAKTRKLEGTAVRSGTDTSSCMGCARSLNWWGILLIPCGFTILVEWLISLAFRIKRARLIILTNLVSNLVMNNVLMFVFGFGKYNGVNYFTMIVIAECIVMCGEFLFYALKIHNYKKWLLAIYTVVANIASWVLYSLLTGLTI